MLIFTLRHKSKLVHLTYCYNDTPIPLKHLILFVAYTNFAFRKLKMVPFKVLSLCKSLYYIEDRDFSNDILFLSIFSVEVLHQWTDFNGLVIVMQNPSPAETSPCAAVM